MRNGITSGVVANVPFASLINAVSETADFSAFVISAIQHNETDGMADAVTVISPDGGHGVMQLTSQVPPNWDDPYANILYAVDNYLEPAETYWAPIVQGDDLVRCIAAEYNAGRGGAIKGHEEGDVDLYTTDHYAARCLATYLSLKGGT